MAQKPKPRMRWFRFYSEALEDARAQALPPELFKTWVNLLCLVNRQEERGVLPSIFDTAFALRLTEAELQARLDDLTARGLFEATERGIMPHKWDVRQADSDSATDRVQRYRDRIRESGETATGYTRHRAEVYERDGHACVYCGGGDRLCLDHLIPVSRGGDHQASNLVTACKACNSGKAGRLPEEAGYHFHAVHANALYAAARARLLDGPAVAAVTVTGVTAPHPVTRAVTPVTPLDQERETEQEQSRAEQSARSTPARADAGADESARARKIVPIRQVDGDGVVAGADWREDGWRSFVASYPGRKKFTDATRAIFDRRCADAPTLERILAGLAAWAESDGWLEQDGRFATKPDDFLHARKYEDTPPGGPQVTEGTDGRTSQPGRRGGRHDAADEARRRVWAGDNDDPYWAEHAGVRKRQPRPPLAAPG